MHCFSLVWLVEVVSSTGWLWLRDGSVVFVLDEIWLMTGFEWWIIGKLNRSAWTCWAEKIKYKLKLAKEAKCCPKPGGIKGYVSPGGYKGGWFRDVLGFVFPGHKGLDSIRSISLSSKDGALWIDFELFLFVVVSDGFVGANKLFISKILEGFLLPFFKNLWFLFHNKNVESDASFSRFFFP